MDLPKCFDNIDHELMMRAVRAHTKEKWVLLYIERWLNATVKIFDNTLEFSEKGTPQGGVVTPLLANLFLHYAFDQWMSWVYPDIPFERYADDAVCHCKTQAQTERLKHELEARMKEIGLELHP